MHTKILAPTLRFPNFKGRWEVKKIKEVLVISSGKSYKHLKKGNIPVYGTGGMMLKVNAFLHNGESVCIGRKGTIDKPKFLKGKFWTVDTLFYTHSFKHNFPYFIYSVFQNINWKKYNESTGVPSLSKSTINEIAISLPTAKEQQKIGNFLSSIDQHINNLRQQLHVWQQYKKVLLQQIFSRHLQFKPANSVDYPKWEAKQLKHIGIILNGLKGKTKQHFGKGKPYIQYKQIFNNATININACGLVAVKPTENQTIFKYGDIFFTASSETPREIGAAAVLLDKVAEIYLNSFCFGYRAKAKLLQANFAQYLFRSPLFRKQLIPLAQGITRYNLSKKSFLQLWVKLPSLAEQQQIGTFLSSIDAKIAHITKRLAASQAFKKGLLQQLFV